MRRLIFVLLAVAALWGCASKIEVQSDTKWSGVVNQADVTGEGYTTYVLWYNAPGFMFSKETEAGYLRVRFKQGKGDEPETTAPYGSIWGQAY